MGGVNRTAAAEDPMTNQPTTAPESTSLDVTRDEADLIIEALQMLCNCRRYAFKDQDEDVEQLHSHLFHSAGDLRQRLRDAFGER